MESFQQIIDKFEYFADIDDDTDSCSYLVDLMEKYEEPADEEIKKNIMEELGVFLENIKRHEAKEFIVLPEIFDHKYNHWYILQWVMARYYRKNNSPPQWYLNLCKICNNENDFPRRCKNIVEKLMETINKA